MQTKDTVILSLDGMRVRDVFSLVCNLGKMVYAFKIHDFYDREGPEVINSLKRAGARRIFLDVKLHDIPETVRLRAKALKEHGADIISVHASGHVNMMRAAIESGVEVYAVTVLTSLSNDTEEVQDIYGDTSDRVVPNLADLVAQSDIKNIVCSPNEVAYLKNRYRFVDLITPGIRSFGVDVHDQKRFDTPSVALRNGATKLVIGRQVIKAKDPEKALHDIALEIDSI